jgi:pimeloyl-ACP methyl ester carboxylesterase
MRTFILPGFSLKNRDWAYQIKEALVSKLPVEVVEWEHWNSGNTDFASWAEWLKRETSRVLNQIGEEKVNILAKSAGTLVAMNVLKTKPSLINKLLLCGIPIRDVSEGDKVMYEMLKNFSGDKVICIQNENDNHGNFREVKEFLDSINPEIEIVSKPRDDHEYPYPDEFMKFLSE